MAKSFKINDKTYKPQEITFNTIAEMEDAGFDMSNFNKKMLSSIRSYFCVCSGLDVDDAGIEMEEHIKNGGDMQDLIACFQEAMERSDFIQALNKRAENEN